MSWASEERLATANLAQPKVSPHRARATVLCNKKSCLLKENGEPHLGILPSPGRTTPHSTWKRLPMKDRSTLDAEGSQPCKWLVIYKAGPCTWGTCTVSITTQPSSSSLLVRYHLWEEGMGCHPATDLRNSGLQCLWWYPLHTMIVTEVKGLMLSRNLETFSAQVRDRLTFEWDGWPKV